MTTLYCQVCEELRSFRIVADVKTTVAERAQYELHGARLVSAEADCSHLNRVVVPDRSVEIVDVR